MSSPRNVAFLVLTAGLGVLAFLVARGPWLRGAEVYAEEAPMVIRTTAGEDFPQPGLPTTDPETDLVSLERESASDQPLAPSDDLSGTTVIWPLEVEALYVLDGRVEQPEGTQAIRSGANSGLSGSVYGSSGRPVTAKVEFLFGPNEGRVLHTDGRGRFGARNLYQGISIVRVRNSDGQAVEREVVLAPMGQKEFHVSFSNTSVVCGTIKDEAGQLVDGAEVRMDGKVAWTDASGVFRFSLVPPGSTFVSVRKEGYAHCIQKVGVRHGSTIAPDDFQIFLKKGATLEISVNRTAGALEPSYAYLMSASGPGRASSGRGFPWYEINPVKIPTGGTALVEGLPLESVNVRLFHRGALAKPKSRNIRLHADRRNAVVLDLEPGPLVRGVVLDGGKPVVGATVEIEAADRSVATSKVMQQRGPRFAMEMVVGTTPAAFDTTRTDGQGRFSFTSHPDLITTYYATATSRDGKRRAVGVIQPDTKNVTLSMKDVEERTGEIVIELPGRFQGLPVDVSIDGTPGDPFLLRPGTPLSLDGLAPGGWRISATWRGANVLNSQLVNVSPEEPVELKANLPPGAIQGQTEQARQRATAAKLIAPERYRPRPR